MDYGRFLVISLGTGSANALFAWLINRIFSANEQYFSLTTNQPTAPETKHFFKGKIPCGPIPSLMFFLGEKHFHY